MSEYDELADEVTHGSLAALALEEIPPAVTVAEARARRAEKTDARVRGVAAWMVASVNAAVTGLGRHGTLTIPRPFAPYAQAAFDRHVRPALEAAGWEVALLGDGARERTLVVREPGPPAPVELGVYR